MRKPVTGHPRLPRTVRFRRRSATRCSPGESGGNDGFGRADLRLVCPALGAWLVALIVLGAPVWTCFAVAGGMLTVGLGLVVVRRGGSWTAPLAATLICAAAASVSVGLRLAAVTEGPLHRMARQGRHVTVELVVTGDPSVLPPEVQGSKLERYVLTPATVRRLDRKGPDVRLHARILVIASSGGWGAVLPGQHIRVSGRLAIPARDPLLDAVLFARGPPHLRDGAGALQRVAERIRAGLHAATRPLPADSQGLLPGLVVGDTSRLPRRLAEDLRITGLGHLTSVSGANVSIVLTAVLGVARVLGLGVRAAPLVGGLAVLGFAVLAHPSPSVLRATVMGLIAVLALATGRTRQGLPALCAATIGLMLFSPGLARSYGFVLSALATGGLLLVMPRWRERLAWRMPRTLAEALAVPAAAQIVCLPVIVMMTGRVSLVALPANLVAAPAVAPATVLGLLAAVLAPLWLPAAELVAVPAGVAARWIAEVAHAGATLPYATVPFPGGKAGGMLALVLLVVVVCARPRWRLLAVVCVVGVLLSAVTLRALPTSWPPDGWVLVMCDVGQGDALVLASGRGAAVVVDAGPDPRRIDRCLDNLGIDRVPLLVLTHPHADHVAGVPGVLRGREIRMALLPPGKPQAAVPLRDWLHAADVSVRRAVAGMRLRVGPLRLHVLGPPGRMHGLGNSSIGEGDDAQNNASIVLRVQWGQVSALLTGDIQPLAQRALLGSRQLRADILKVPHHGSAYQARTFLAAVDPRVALVSVGRDNDYGHPDTTVLGVLRRLGAQVFRTDRHGSVAVVSDGRQLRVVSRDVMMRTAE